MLKGKDGNLAPVSWEDALVSVAKMLDSTPSDQIAAVAGGLVDAEVRQSQQARENNVTIVTTFQSLTALKDLLNRLGSETLCTEEIFPMEASATDLRSNYLFNTSIAGVEDADFALLIGCNPRFDAPVFNARLRKCWIHNELNVGMVGPKLDLTYDYDHLGETTDALKQLADGTHPYSAKMAAAKNPIVIVGSDALGREDGGAVMAYTQQIAARLRQTSGCGHDWAITNVLHKVASQVAALDLGYKPGMAEVREAKPKVLWLLGADAGAISREELPADCFVIYQVGKIGKVTQ